VDAGSLEGVWEAIWGGYFGSGGYAVYLGVGTSDDNDVIAVISVAKLVNVFEDDN